MLRAVLLLGATLAFGAPAWAQQVTDDTNAPIGDDVLDNVQPGVTIDVVSVQDLDATNTGNTVTGDTVSSGNIEIGADAFSGFDGVGNFVVNTGHNNNLQGSISIIVVLPAGVD